MCPCVCGTEIQNSILIIAAAANVFKKTWGLLFYPLFHNVAVIIAALCWIVGLIFIGTAGKLETNADGVHTLVYNEDMQRVLVYYVICLVWIVEWMAAMGFMVVSGAILIAFFDNDRLHGEEHEPRFPNPLLDSFKLVTYYHMGTAAIGSFFITLIVLIRWVLTYLSEKVGKETNIKWLAACVNCCCKCVEECLKYMVRKAYILTVLEGRWFFSAVCGGLEVVIFNINQIMTTSSIAFILLWLCKLAVPLGCTFFAHLMIQGGVMGVHQDDLSSAFNILVPVFAISCVFSFTFMGLLDTSIEVCLVAFCKLEEIDADHPELNVMNAVPEDIAECFTDLRERVKDDEDRDNGTDAGTPFLQGEKEKATDLEDPASKQQEQEQEQ